MSGIEIKSLTKTYGDTLALDDVSLTLEAGKIYGLLGRNGAGKTTLLNIITGRVLASGGTVTLDGAPTPENDAALQNIYMLSEHTYYPEKMRVRDALKWSAAFYPDFDPAYAAKLCDAFALDTRKKVASLSTGYGTIFKLIVGLSTNVPYLLLDEPVLGLDANHRDLFYKTLVEKYAEKPFCAVLSTHLVEEVSSIVEDVVIIKNGRVIQNTSRDELLCQGYSVSGVGAAVDEFVRGQRLLGQDVLGGLKTAYVLGDKPDNLPDTLVTDTLDLQRLFIQLTND